ncbi:MAG: tRNA-dihydrouridine synthase [Candidatus Levybacteria bacterium]|nr:tRNA-dihydrouridine synthase [Candidatus Levybacteria bacterium]
MTNFWSTLPKPFFVMAPMEDVTDTVFRQIIRKCGAPDVFFTEFTNADGLFSRGYEYVARRLVHTSIEQPLIAQIWGTNPDNFYKAGKLLYERGFVGIDINMGCPEKGITARGACSGLINNPPLAKEIVQATQEGSHGLPVSVKTRLGFKEMITEEWASFLLNLDLEALTIHGRTAKEMSEVPAHWDEIGKVVKLRDKMEKHTVIIGNGDIVSRQDGLDKVAEYGLDGIMIGRGIFKDPWIFNKDHFGDAVTQKEKLEMYLEHVRLYEKTWEDTKYFPVLKKFAKCYINTVDGASEMRDTLMHIEDFKEYKSQLEKYLSGI